MALFRYFFSPELSRFEDFGTPVDVWALGVTSLYLLFRTYRVFFHDYEKDLIPQTFLLLPRIISGVRPDYLAFVAECMVMDQKSRKTAKQLKTVGIFKDVNWDAVEAGKTVPTFNPLTE